MSEADDGAGRAGPAPVADGRAAARVPPRTEAERRVAAAWSEVLGIGGIGADDAFFDVGGHSLAATRVAARLREAHGVEVPLGALTGNGTVAQVAALATLLPSAGDAVEPAPRGGDLPLSFSQQRVWFLAQLAPESQSYHSNAVLTFHGRLNVDALAASLSALVARHEIYRTTFPTVDGGPVQRIHPPWTVRLALADLSALPPAGRQAAAEARLRDELARRFDLAALPLVRWTLLRMADDEHRLVMVEHHVVHDGWSFNLFLRELLALYRAFDEGRPDPLATPAPQFADYAHFQRRWLRGDEARRQTEFWRRRLAGSPPVLELAFDRPRPAEQRFRGAAPRHHLPAELYHALRDASRRAGVTLFSTMMAAFHVLLWRWSGQTDLNVGTAIANRRPGWTHGLIGMLVNSVVVRARLDDDPPFAALARRVHAEVVAAADHQELPFEAVVEALHPPRSLAHNPLFQTSFSFHDSPVPPLTLPGLRVEVVPGLPNGSAKFDLNVIAIPHAEQRVGQGTAERTEEDDGITLIWEYATDLFDPATIETMVGQYRALLDAVAAEPDTPISRLPAAGPAAAPHGDADDPAEVPEWTVPERVALQAARSPEALAVADERTSLDYRGLDERANRLANHLRALGVGAETGVGVCLERGVDLVVALLAVLKAGGAYVPLDPAYPPERLAYMLDDCAAAVLVTRDGLRGRLHPPAQTHVVRVDGDAAAIAAASAAAPPRGVGARNLAYVVYTSGSTGTPKGVAVEHRGLAALCAWHASAFEVTATDRATQMASPAFDAAGWEVWPYLAAGASVRVVADEVRADPEALRDWMVAGGVTVSFAPTPVAEPLLALEWPAGTALRWLLTGGDRLRARPAAALPFRLSNNYGPTECTVVATSGPVGADGTGLPAIGRPLPGTAACVVDAALRRVPAGVPGELCLGGVQVARGYLGQPARTAERFVPHPYAATPGARMYRTGDRVRWAPAEAPPVADDARTSAPPHLRTPALEYLGRLDRQVKVRGYRVETGEIEAVLRRHPGVRACVVAARHDGPGGETRLVAYVVGEAAAEALRPHLRQSLPEHMVPAAFVRLGALPLTPNGKLDRDALPAPVHEPPPGAAPRGELEAHVADAWRTVLGVPAVGVHDNFFDVGGTSMRLTHVYAALRRIRPDLRMVDLFRHTTVAAQAAFLAAADVRDGGSPAAVDSSSAADASPGAARATRARPPARPLRRRAARPCAPRPHRAGRDDAVAVVGMSCRVPGAADPAELWRNLCAGVESVRFFTDGELLAAGVSPHDVRDPAYIRAYGTLEDAYAFDAGFFQVTPREAQLMDPQHRVFLECAWSALEDAGVDPARSGGAIGVYAGSKHSLHAARVRNDPGLAAMPPRLAVLGSAADFLATRVSYKLGLRGPAIAVQTACSTSLVAIHLACRALLGGECELALAGGVNVVPDEVRGYRTQEGAYLSPDGHCRAFDARAGGTVSGSGAGVVVLKRLADALRDGDTIRAVVRGSAINNDGAAKIGFSAPSVEGQARVVAAALRAAGVEPSTVGYVEAHGTGTPLGDPIEATALAEAFRGVGRGRVALGSVKTNLGHLDSAAGVAGFIKAVLALEHGAIPPTLHFERANPETGLDASPFFVNTALRPWPRGGTPRRAGVSSLGIGGTNAHVVLEEAPSTEEAGAEAPGPHLLVLSARSESALDRMRARLADRLASAGPPLADVAFTLREGRAAFPHRWAAAVADVEDARAALGGTRERKPARRRAADREPPVAFLFPGQGTMYAGMAAALYAREPVFRDEIGRCAAVLAGELGGDLRDVLFPGPGREPAAGWMDEMRIAQPALFAVEWALARVWMHRGVRPGAVIGHSAGEYAAACVAGVFPLDDALRLVAARGRLLDTLPAGGAMLAVPLGERETAALLPPRLSLAAVNGPANCVVSGDVGDVDALAAALAERGIEARRLHIAQAGHSPAMDAILDAFAAEVRRARRSAPSIPLASNLTGGWLTAEQATDPGYWVRHLRETVRFSDGVGRLLEDPARVLLEVGPGETLGTFARRRAGGSGRVIVRSLAPAGQPEPADLALLDAAGALWTAGVDVDWAAIRGPGRRRRVPLPTYPFERETYPVPPEFAPASVAQNAAPSGPRVDTSASTAHIAPAPNGTAATDTPAAPAASPHAAIGMRGRVAGLFAGLVGDAPSALDPDATFLELGADSLLLMQLSRQVEGTFGVRIPFRQLLTSLATIHALAAHLERHAPVTATIPADPPEATRADVSAPANDPGARQRVAELIAALLGREADALDPGATFVELGADSLLLMQASREVERAFGVRIPFRQLLTALSTIEDLSAHLEHAAPVRSTPRITIPDARSTAGAGNGAPPPSPGPSADVGRADSPAAHPDSNLEHKKDISGSVDSFLSTDEITAPGGSFALTPAQQQIWLHAQLGEGAARAYNIQIALELRGPLDLRALGAALNDVAAHHEALRIVFDPLGEWQAVLPSVTIPFILQPLPEDANGGDRLAAAMAEAVHGAFDLSAGPLVRAHVHRIGDDHHVLQVVIHHLLADAIALGVVERDLATAYGARLGGAAPRLPDAMQFGEYAALVAGRLDGGEAWRPGLEGAAPLVLPYDRPRPAAPAHRGASVARTLPPALTASVAGLTRREGCTPFAALLAALMVVLHRWSGQDDVVVGVPFAGRPFPGAERMVGSCANVLPVRGRLHDTLAVREYLLQLRDELLDAHAHELAPPLPPDAPRAPRAPGLMTVAANPTPPRDAAALAFAGLRAERLGLAAPHAVLDLHLTSTEHDGALELLCTYDAELFDASTVAWLLARVERVLEQAVADPCLRLAALEVMDPAERRAVIETEIRAVPPVVAESDGAGRAGMTEPSPSREPRTPVEAAVAVIWAEVLGRAGVDAGQSFFDQGGNSLLASRVLTRLRRVFGVQLPLAAVFDDPTIAGLAARVETLLRERQGLTMVPSADAERADGPEPSTAAESASSPPVTEADQAPAVEEDGAGTFPLSFAQERLWFLDRVEPGSALYNTAGAWRLEGPLDVPALERALGEIVRRHGALRTTIAQADGRPVQVVAPFRGFALAVDEVPGASVDEVRRLASAWAGRPFDLAAGPLFSPRLLRVGADDHVLVIAIHHVVSDGWSFGILLHELGALYAAFREGRPSPLPPLAARYADHATWERGDARQAEVEAQLSYWRPRLAGAPALLELPTDHPRPAVQTYRGAQESLELPAELLGRLRALLHGEGASLFMVLLAASQVLLARHAGSDDVVVGTPVAGRARPETEGLIGLFVNTLVLRTDLAGDPTFREALLRVRTVTLDAYDHQAVPFERLVEALRPERSLSHSPLVQVLVSLDETAGLQPRLAGVRTSGVGVEVPVSKLDLSFGFGVAPGRFTVALEYATDLFERATIVRMLGQLRRVLEQVAADPDLRLSTLELADAAERRRVVEEWNRTDADLPGACVHELFAAQAARTPHAPALVRAGTVLSYRALDERAGRLARRLASLGVRAETRVAISLERGPDLVIGMLAVLKAGGACVPLDPAYPAERLRGMLEDSGAAVLVTQASLRGLVRLPSDVRLLSVDAAPDERETEFAGELDDAGEPGALAYVLYTSGSTGAPKGVAIEHRALANYVIHAARQYALGPGDRVLQFHSPAFDPAAEEVFATLLSGATLVIAADAAADPRVFWDACRRERITVLDLPTAVWQSIVPWLESRPESLPGTLRLLVTGGERMLPDALAAWRRAAGGRVRLLNSYGPTETTIGATLWEAAADGPRATVPIGRPVPNTRCYVLDAAIRPAPVGVPGELCVGGVQVARGYPGRPALTAERFVPDPFGPAAGARLYRTGDRARWKADGTLEYLGRLDAQVKVRGYRVEPGEIEAALRRHPGVPDCAVVAREHAPGDQRLVAYVAGDADAEALRAHLRGILPGHMIPGAFVRLDALPLTPAGKVDRRALPAPPVENGRGPMPGTETEARVAAVWRELLGRETVGVEDSFFELGGHSLLLVRLQARLEAEFGAELSVVDLFQHPTVRSQAARLLGEPDDSAAAPDDPRAAARQAGLARLAGLRRAEAVEMTSAD